MSKQKLIVANWKANPLTLKEAKNIAKGIIKNSKKYKNVDVVLCPSHLHIEEISKMQMEKTVAIGAQDAFSDNTGAHTGEVTVDMIREIGTDYVIVGHSERRAMGETEQDVAKKLRAVLDNKMKVILCIGEQERDVDGNYLAFVHDQLRHSLGDVTKKDISNIIIAYEPVWAIGKSELEAMKGVDMHEMTIFIQRIFNDAFGKESVKKLKILYGGSVSPVNAGDILENGKVDGFLVGRQSLYPDSFGEIIKIANESRI